MREYTKRVRVWIDVDVIDEGQLREFLKENEEEWGFDEGQLSEGALGEAVYQAVVGCPVPPLDVGLEIVDFGGEVVRDE